MYIDKMSVKSDDSSNCIYSASSGCKQQSKASFHNLFCAGAMRALGKNPVLLWMRFYHDHLGNLRGYVRKRQCYFCNSIWEEEEKDA